eukprot:TRINITY_DN5705_c0_g1_i1.p1 TRINITY_DN5705_c0_g1~~TRINITY_DN5705_c0_g1_i1.p1  ORF type:complete len:397 (+),score=46.88 TRINITY_DN5705_c0_g1_i1:94-1191(+)
MMVARRVFVFVAWVMHRNHVCCGVESVASTRYRSAAAVGKTSRNFATAIDSHRSRRVVACNGYPEDLPAQVGLRQLTESGISDENSHSGVPNHRARVTFRHHRHSHLAIAGRLSLRGSSALLSSKLENQELAGRLNESEGVVLSEPDADDTLWTRTLEYGSCDEYHVDLDTRQLFFVSPNGKDVCYLAPSAFASGGGEGEGYDPAVPSIAVVLSQYQVGSPRCHLRVQTLYKRSHHAEGGAAAAELAMFDVFTQPAGAMLDRITAEESALAPLDSGAVVRLEDVIDSGAISSETIGTATLSFGRGYAIEPTTFHVVLEDFRGSKEFDRHDVDFKGNKTYVSFRAGRSGDPEHPQHLFVYRCEEED